MQEGRKEEKEQKKQQRAYTEADRVELWERWARGESSKAIARAMDRGASVYSVLLRHGGIRPRTRRRSPRELTLAEREEISRGVAAGRLLRWVERRRR